jgi:brefeldin A-inhibited guanine nucleotide-exchange protein
MSTEKLRNSTDLKVQSKSYYCFDKNGQPVFLPDENGTEEMSQSSSSTRNRSRSINSIADEELSYPSALEDGLIEYLPTTHARLLKQAINNFNRSPMTARDFLVARRMLIGSPNDLAQFIFENRPKLSKKKLGHFLGENNAFNQKVCDCLLLKYSFEGMSIDEALRSVVRLFCLPKETQQIDRIVEKFANVYFNQNVSRRHMPCRSADAAHVLVFSILMLNTDLHNKSVTPDKKMTKEQFINNNQGQYFCYKSCFRSFKRWLGELFSHFDFTVPSAFDKPSV